jgi:hypothetical protein
MADRVGIAVVGTGDRVAPRVGEVGSCTDASAGGVGGFPVARGPAATREQGGTPVRLTTARQEAS